MQLYLWWSSEHQNNTSSQRIDDGGSSHARIRIRRKNEENGVLKAEVGCNVELIRLSHMACLALTSNLASDVHKYRWLLHSIR
jgi:hypothetical protein